MGMPDRKNWSPSAQTVGEFLEAFFPGRDIAAELEPGLRLVESFVPFHRLCGSWATRAVESLWPALTHDGRAPWLITNPSPL